MFNLKNKIILVTGGYGYLGSSIVKGFLKQNATVIVLGRNRDKFESVFQGCSIMPIFKKFDISDTSDIISQIYKEIEEEYGRIDVLFNNAFSLPSESDVSNLSDEVFNKGIEGTLGSVHKCIKCVIPFLKKNGFGQIINISSMYGMIAPDFSVYEGCKVFTNPPHYGAAKAGVIQLTKYFASLLGKENILVNSISPGPFPSLEVQKNKKFIESLGTKNVLNRIGKPEELQGISVFLASNESSYVTGQNFAIDGGWTII